MKKENIINWNDKYKTLLCIYHHLRENTRKYEKYVDIKADVKIEEAKLNFSESYIYNFKTGETTSRDRILLNEESAQEVAKYELNKELIDLYLLLESHINQNNLENLIKERIERFEKKGDV